jgi:hypothetical protein
MSSVSPDPRIRDPNIRASNADRKRAVAALNRHRAAGRLDEAELKARIAAVEQAKTHGDIAAATADLPGLAGRKPRTGFRRGSDWRTWLAGSLTTWAIWAVEVVTDKHHNVDGYWPLWVMVPWGAVVLADSLWGDDD